MHVTKSQENNGLHAPVEWR